jgi:hypothetical protein
MRGKGFGRLIVAVILAVGFATVWAMVAAWGAETLIGAASGDVVTQMLRFRADGTPVIQSWPAGHWERVQVRDLAGRPVSVADDERWLNGVFLSSAVQAAGASPAWSDLLRPFSDGRRPPVYWYFVAGDQGDRTAYLVGYDSLTTGRVGFLGKNGFRDQLPAAEERFPFEGTQQAVASRVHSAQPYYGAVLTYAGSVAASDVPGSIPSWDVYVHASDDKVYQVNLQRHTVRLAFAEAPAVSAGLLWSMAPQGTAGAYSLAVRTDREIVLLDADNRVTRRQPIPDALLGRDFFWAQTPDRGAIVYDTRRGPFWDPTASYDIYRLGPAGRLEWRHEVTLPANPTQRYAGWYAGAALPVPLLIDAIVLGWLPGQLVSEANAAGYCDALAAAAWHCLPSLITVQIVGLAVALLCYRRQILFGASAGRPLVWTLLVFLFGLPMWVGYRYGRRWPLIEHCSSCGAFVPVDRPRCRACETEFPLPAPKGTEVFA